jgi:hypothetical protein
MRHSNCLRSYRLDTTLRTTTEATAMASVDIGKFDKFFGSTQVPYEVEIDIGDGEFVVFVLRPKLTKALDSAVAPSVVWAHIHSANPYMTFSHQGDSGNGRIRIRGRGAHGFTYV